MYEVATVVNVLLKDLSPRLQMPFEPASDAAVAAPPAPASVVSAGGAASEPASDDDECEQQQYRPPRDGTRCPSLDRQLCMSAGPDSTEWDTMQVRTASDSAMQTSGSSHVHKLLAESLRQCSPW